MRYFVDLSENHYRNLKPKLGDHWNKCITVDNEYTKKYIIRFMISVPLIEQELVA